MELHKKVALVTGAASGIGKAIAQKFLKQGATVMINDVDAKSLKKTFEELSLTHQDVYSYDCDIADQKSVEGLYGHLFEKTGTIDILVNNAGITRDSFLHKMDDEDFDRVMQVNLYGTYHCTRAAIHTMRENQWGRIINISSVVGISGNMGQTNYAASKAAVIGFSKSLALESAKKNITVNVIAPGFIHTDMTAKIPAAVTEKIKAKIPMGVFGKTADIANMAAFLASDEAAYITGQVLSVNGGYLI